MMKRACLTFTLIMLSSVASVAASEQSSHIQTELKQVLLSWQKAKAQIVQLTKLATPEIVSQTKTAINTIIKGRDFQKNLTATTNSQRDNIIKGSLFKDVQYIPNITDYLTAEKAQPFLVQFYNAMVNEIYSLRLWQKLTQKK